jgi:3-oxoacyl-[acyl-carrier protein] reductase
MVNLTGQVAVVTGASRGIGKAIALGYADAGASVCCAARSLADLESTVAEIGADQALAVQTDVTDYASLEAMYAATIEKFGRLDIVVINAGVSPSREPIPTLSLDAWHLAMDVNLTGAFYTAKAALPHLLERGGKMIVIGSGVGHRVVPSRAAYGVSKAGAWMLTRVLAEDLLEYKIAVNELVPGPVVTDMTQHMRENPAGFPVQREWMKQPEDVVPLALYLASLPNDGPTGQNFSLMRRDGQ